MAAPFVEPIRAALASIEKGSSVLMEIEGAPDDVLVGYCQQDHLANIWVDGRPGQSFWHDSPEHGARDLALRLARKEGT